MDQQPMQNMPQQPVQQPGVITKDKPGAMSPQWFTKQFKPYMNFTGRAGRTEFWSVQGLLFIAFFLIGIVFGILGSISESLLLAGNAVVGLLYLALLIPMIGLLVRRLHDTNKSGWFALISFIPLIGAIVLFVFEVLPSDEGSNDYGVKP